MQLLPRHWTILSLLLFQSIFAAEAAEFPTRPLRLVIPFGPGGNGDILGRLVGQRLTENLGQSVVIDNRAGASNIIGTEIVAKAPPDGYTMLLVTSAYATNPTLAKHLPYDSVRDFTPVTSIASTPFILVAHPSLPAKTVRELIALAKAKPGQLNYSSSGPGTSQHLAGALFAYMAHINLIHVPYRMTAQAVTDVIAGNVQLVFPSITMALSNVKAGKLKALGITSSKRSPLAPDLPTISEAGVAGYNFAAWTGIVVPAATPQAIVAKLNAEIVGVLNSPETRQRIAGMGADVVPSSPSEFAAFIASEIPKWAAVLKSTGIKSE